MPHVLFDKTNVICTEIMMTLVLVALLFSVIVVLTGFNQQITTSIFAGMATIAFILFAIVWTRYALHWCHQKLKG